MSAGPSWAEGRERPYDRCSLSGDEDSGGGCEFTDGKAGQARPG